MRTLFMLAMAASTAAAQTDHPLSARILPPDRGRMVFEVSDQAYVAIFTLRRSNRRSLIYSSSATRGEHTIEAGFYTRADYTGEPLETTLILVASRRPLHVRQLRDSTLTVGENEDGDALVTRLTHEIASPGAVVTTDSYLVRQ